MRRNRNWLWLLGLMAVVWWLLSGWYKVIGLFARGSGYRPRTSKKKNGFNL
ncbi:hypothetical protein IM774_08990 [Erysipelotrichaceae bacterium RD49]|nr:hypothetical protein [Erysipelotrichaceae bacterium RD49]